MSRPSQGSVVTFLLITFAVSWAFFISVAAAGSSTLTPLHYVLVLLGTIAPSLVALGLTARSGGGPAVSALLGRALRWEVAGRWYVFALGYIATVKLAVALVLRLATGAWPRFGTEPLILIPFAIAISTPVQAGEEIGWRGYALPRLAARIGLRAASILLGVIWAVWHLPLFFVRGGDTYGQSFVIFLLQVIAMSVTMAWLYGRTRSLLLVMLLHAAANNSKDIVPSATPGGTAMFGLAASSVAWLAVTFLWVFAAGFLVRMPKAVPGGSSPD